MKKIDTLHKGQGMKTLSSMRNDSGHNSSVQTPGGDDSERKAVKLVLMIAGVALLLLVSFLILKWILGTLFSSPEYVFEEETEPTETQSDIEGEVSSGTFSYALNLQDDGLWAVVRLEEGQSPFVLAKLEGEPIALMRYEDVIVVPENTSEGWDIACMAIIYQTEVSYVTDDNGEKIVGAGTLISAELDNGVIDLTYSQDGVESSTSIKL